MRIAGILLGLFMASACGLGEDRRKQAEEEARRAAEKAALVERKAGLDAALSQDRPDRRQPVDHDEAQRAVDAAAPSSSSPSSQERPGPIDRLVTRLDHDHLWRNGHFAKIPLPRDATPEAVLSALLEATTFDRGKVKTHTISETREVRIGGATYVALMIETNLGAKLVLMQYADEKVGWWTRVFDPE